MYGENRQKWGGVSELLAPIYLCFIDINGPINLPCRRVSRLIPQAEISDRGFCFSVQSRFLLQQNAKLLLRLCQRMQKKKRKKEFTWTQHGRNRSLLVNRVNLQKNLQECCPLHSPSIKTARFFSFPQISLPLSSPVLRLSSIKFYFPVLLPLYSREPSTTLFGLGLFMLSTPIPFTARRHHSLRRPSRQQ